MALIKCPECGKEVSDKACSCPNCGYPISTQPVEQAKAGNAENEENEEELIFCPKCLSTHVHTEQKGFSGGKALAGAITVGGIGLLAGTIGSKKVNITCLKCGHKFMAGNALIATRTEKEKILKELESRLANGDKLGAVKFLNERLNWGTSQSMGFIASYLKGHQALKEKASEPKTMGDIIGVSVVLFMIAFVIVSVILAFIWGEANTGFWISCAAASALIIAGTVKMAKSDIKKLKEKKKEEDN